MQPLLINKLASLGFSGSGLSSVFSDIADNLTSTGTTQATALESNTAILRFTTVPASSGVKLDNGSRGDSQLIINDGANTLKVYPPDGHQIFTLASNAAFSLEADTAAVFMRASDTLWLYVPSSGAATATGLADGLLQLQRASANNLLRESDQRLKRNEELVARLEHITVTSLAALRIPMAAYIPSTSTCFTDTAGTIAAAVGNSVARINDSSGNGQYLVQGTAANQPTLQQDSHGNYYLSFDGSNDYLVSNSAIKFGRTNRMTVFAGIKITNTSAARTVFEHGTTTGLAGTFKMMGPPSIGSANVSFTSVGTTTSSTSAASRTTAGGATLGQLVITATADLGEPRSSIDINGGVNTDDDRTAPGERPFRNDLFHLGSAAGGASNFNGRVYGVILVGSLLNEDQTLALQRYMAGLTTVGLPTMVFPAPQIPDLDAWTPGTYYHMTTATLGSDGTVNTWPTAVLNPRASGYNFVLFDPGDYTARGSITPTSPGAGGSGGTKTAPLIYAYVNGAAYDLWTDPHPANRASQAFINGFNLGTGGEEGLDHIILYGLKFKSSVLFNRTVGSAVIRCLWDNNNNADQPFRLRFGSHGCALRECLVQRFPPYATSGDVVAVQISDDRNISNYVEYNSIINLTDGVQTTGRLRGDGSNTDYGIAAGTVIRHNYMGYTSESRNGDGTSIAGVENSLDFKTGGVEYNPMLVHDNFMFGLWPNAGTPGYLVTLHDVCEYVEFARNYFVDSAAGLFFNLAYLNDVAGQPFRTFKTVVRENYFSDIANSGATGQAANFASKNGRVITGTNSCQFQKNQVMDCDYLAESVPTSEAGRAMFGDNLVTNDVDLGAYSSTWTDGQVTTGYTITSETLTIPYTAKTITVKRLVKN